MSVPASVLELQGPVLAAREDVSAAFRLLLEDRSHYGVARKDRDSHGMTVCLEEFSAVSDGPERRSTWPSGSGRRGRGGVRRQVLRGPRRRAPPPGRHRLAGPPGGQDQAGGALGIAD
jgi:hypothetical protein